MKIKTLLRQSINALIIFGLAGVVHADIEGKIIGGTIAPATKFPTTVALLIKEDYELVISGNAILEGDPVAAEEAYFQSQFCAGTLLAPQWVLTAAHCLVNFSAGEILVLAGTQTLEIPDTGNPPGQRLDVSDVVTHPNYNLVTYDSDLALLKLTTGVTGNIPVSAIFQGSLAETIISPNAVACDNADNCATIVGWGTTDEVNGADFPVDLLETQLPIVSNIRCDAFLGGGITTNMLCAGFEVGGKDTCQGDSGGPLFMSASGDPSAQDFEIAGITSFGAGCAQPDSPGGYTRVSVFTNYINDFISGNVPTTALPMINNAVSSYSVSTSAVAPIAVTTLTATDGDNDILNWSLSDTFDPSFAGDSAFFAIDSNGLLQLTSVPNPINNPYRMIVKVSDDDGADLVNIEVTLINDQVSASRTTLSASPASVDADNATASTVTVTLNNSLGQPITDAGNIVQISVTGSANVSSVTNVGDGSYTATITNGTAETVTVSATASGVSVDETDTINFIAVAEEPLTNFNGGSGGGGGSTGWLLLALLGFASRVRRELTV